MVDKRIIIACGAGFATSTAGEDKVKKICEELGIEAEIKKRRVIELSEGALKSMNNVDLIVLMSATKLETDIPTVNGISFISGVGKKKTIEEIKNILTD